MSRFPGTYMIVMLLALLFIRLPAQERISVTLEFPAEQFRMIPSGEAASRVEAPDGDFHYPEQSGMPALPLKQVWVLLPPGADPEGFDPAFEEVTVGEGLQLIRIPEPVATNQDQPRIPGSSVFQGNFPEERVRFNGRMIQRGVTWLSFTVSPFRFESQSGVLRLAHTLRLEVAYRPAGQKSLPLVPEDPELAGFIESRVVNPSDFQKYYHPSRAGHLKSTSQRVDYLIVTSEELKAAFEPMMEWKTRKGLRAELVTVEQIRHTYPGSSIQIKIKECLYRYYTENHLKWVLLGGDAHVVPVQGCYSKINNLHIQLTDPSVPTDLFYSCFDHRLDWNSNPDEKIGQMFFDNNDLVPEIYLSRLPVRTPGQVREYVRKLLDYELHRPEEGYEDKLMLAGVKAWSEWNGRSDSHHRSDYIFRKYIDETLKGERVNFFDTGTDFEANEGYHVTGENFKDQLNNGYGLIHFAGHGNYNCLVMEKGPVFSVEDILQLNNPVSGVMLSNACHVSAFDTIDPCLGEAFIRNPSGGSMAFFGSSRFGYGNPNQSTVLGPSLRFNASFLKQLFPESPQGQWNAFATVSARAKLDQISQGTSGGVYDYLQYAINPLGDPELPIYTRKPSRMEKVRIYRIGSSLSVHNGGVENSRICLTSLDLSEGYHQVAENRFSHTFEDIPGAFQVTITAPNHIPYTYVSGTVTWIREQADRYVRIYPNPVYGQMTVEVAASGGVLRIFDMHGRMLLERELLPGTQSIDVSSLAAGTYMLQFQTEYGTARKRIIKLSAH